MKDKVIIFDTTLRDGEQAPGFSMNLQEKLLLGLQIEKLNVDVIEAGFPASSPDDFLAVKELSKILKKPEVCGLSRAIKKDIEICWEAIKYAKKQRIHTFMSTSDLHLKYQFKKTKKEALKISVDAVSLAKSLCPSVEFSPMDAGRSEKDFLVKILNEVIKAGATTINIPDTVGYLTPQEYGNLIEFLIKNVKDSNKVTWSTHCHNDLGLSTANALSGVKNGARQIECTINGIGERAGNTSLEEVVMTLKTRSDFYKVTTSIETTELYNTSKLLERITGQKVQANKAIVGVNSFAHEAGIHQHGLLSNKETYEIMTPESVGVNKTNFVLGKHSGSAALNKKLKTMGYSFDEEKLIEIFKKFKTLADIKKDITDSDLNVLMMNEKYENNNVWILESFDVISGNNSKPNAKIKLKNTKTNQIELAESNGSGMVDSAYKCINKICKEPGELMEFIIDSVTNGIDAQAVVNLRVKLKDGSILTGRSGNTDIVKASILAYLDIINKKIKKEEC